MKLHVIKAEQGEREIYITKMSGEDFLDQKIKIDEWSRGHIQGYQREPSLSRVNAFQRYLALGNIAPTSVVLSIREKTNFEPKDAGSGILDIPEDSILWVVDGQHRIAGLRQLAAKGAKFEEFDIPVVIICTGNWASNTKEARYEELVQFLIINKTQKGVRPDLAERLLALIARKDEKFAAELPASISRGLDWVPRAITVAEMLNSDAGVWKDKIRFPNEPKGRAIITQKSFTDSLRPVLMNENFKSVPEKEVVIFLQRYWNVIKEMCPEAFQEPQRFIIQKLTGTFVLHRLFCDVVGYCKDRRVSEENLKGVLSKIPKEMNSDYWSITGYAGRMGSNQKAFGILEREIRNELMHAHPEVKAVRPFEL